MCDHPRGVRIFRLLGAVLGLFAASCAGPRASAGLLDGELPTDTMAPDGDMGFDGLTFFTTSATTASGMRVAFERAATRGMVGVVLGVGAGAINDPAGKEGLAHFVEHLVFRGRTDVAADAPTVAERLNRIGATFNAFTSLDATKYILFAPRAALPELLEIAAVVLGHPLGGIDAHGLEIEREIVQNELRQRNESRVYGQVMGWMQTALFAVGHPYARAVGGTSDTLRGLTLPDARQFATQHYRTESATMLVVSDLTPDEVKTLLTGGMPRPLLGNAASARKPDQRLGGVPIKTAPAASAGFVAYQAPVSLPEAWIAWALPSIYSPTGAQVKVVSAPAVEQRLQEAFRGHADVVRVNLVAFPWRTSTLLALQVILTDAKVRPEVVKQVSEVFTSLWSQFTKRDLQQLAANLEKEGRNTLTQMTGLLLLRDRAQVLFGMRQQAVAQVVLRSESFVARALDRSDYLQNLGDPATYERGLSDVIALTPTDIAAFAERYLKGDRSRVLYLDPIPAGQRTAPGAVGVAGGAELAGALGNDTPVLGADLGDAPRVPPPPEIAQARHYHLRNGLEVAIIPRRQFPAVTAVLSFNGGTAAGEPRGVVDLLRIVQSPTLSLAANAMEVNAYDGIDFTSDVVRAGKRNLGNALYLLAARVTRADGIDWDEALAPPEEHAAPVEPAPQVKATRAFWQALYGDHPYGRSSSYADWLAITPDQMRAWIVRMHNPRNAALIIAGDVDVAATKILVERWFGSWQIPLEAVELQPPRPPALPFAGQAHETVLVQHRPGVSQTEIMLGCRLPAGGQQALAKYQLLAGQVGSQLQTRLREEAGASYSIDANAAVLRGGSAHLVVTALVDDSRFGAVLKVVRGLWRHMGDSGFDRGSLSQIKWRNATGSNLGFQTSTEFALRTLDALNRGASTDFAVRMERQYIDTTPADLHAAFQVCRATTVMSLVGDEAKIRAAK